jgi:hypothetical protein
MGALLFGIAFFGWYDNDRTNMKAEIATYVGAGVVGMGLMVLLMTLVWKPKPPPVAAAAPPPYAQTSSMFGYGRRRKHRR